MRVNIMSMAAESIDFQDGSLFAKLAAAIDAMKDDADLQRVDDRTFFESRKANAIPELFKAGMGLNFSINVIEDAVGPSIIAPLLDKNHVFWTESRRYNIDTDGMMNNYSGQKDVDDVMKLLNTKFVKGAVDLKRAKVTGVFEQMQFKLFIPRSHFAKRGIFTSQEVAAVIMHEIGHMFTYMEFLTRMVTTNQALAGIVRSIDKTFPADKREIAFIKASELLEMDNSQREALIGAKSQKELCCVVLDGAIQKSISELGVSLYDVNSCEYLADQFASRMGAGRYIVSYLDKLYRDYGIVPNGAETLFVTIMKTVINIIAILMFSAFTAGLPLILIALMIASEDKQYNIYDNDKARFTRIKQQNIERLKDQSLSKEEKASLVEDNEAIDKIAKVYADELNFIQKAAYYLRPSYRKAHKFELLQKDLESLASNDLFHMSAKLATV